MPLILLFVCLLTLTCSNEVVKKEAEKPKESQAWKRVKAVVERECVRCHNGSIHPLNFKVEKVFAGSKSQTRVSNGTMPPDKTLSVDDKDIILSYFN